MDTGLQPTASTAIDDGLDIDEEQDNVLNDYNHAESSSESEDGEDVAIATKSLDGATRDSSRRHSNRTVVASRRQEQGGGVSGGPAATKALLLSDSGTSDDDEGISSTDSGDVDAEDDEEVDDGFRRKRKGKGLRKLKKTEGSAKASRKVIKNIQSALLRIIEVHQLLSSMAEPRDLGELRGELIYYASRCSRVQRTRVSACTCERVVRIDHIGNYIVPIRVLLHIYHECPDFCRFDIG